MKCIFILFYRMYWCCNCEFCFKAVRPETRVIYRVFHFQINSQKYAKSILTVENQTIVTTSYKLRVSIYLIFRPSPVAPGHVNCDATSRLCDHHCCRHHCKKEKGIKCLQSEQWLITTFTRPPWKHILFVFF